MSQALDAPRAWERYHPRNVFLGWWMVGAVALLQAAPAALFLTAYGSYVVVLRDQFGWSKTALAGASSLREAESGLTNPIHGWLLDRFGPRKVMAIGNLVLGGGFMLFSQVNSLWSFYLVFVVMALGSSACGFLSANYIAVQWFDRRRGTAIAVTATGLAVGGMLTPLVVLMLDNLGWRTTAFISGIIIIVVGQILIQFIRAKPEDVGLLPDGATPGEVITGRAAARGRSLAAENDYTLGEALRSRQFWLIGGAHGAAMVIVSAVNVHMLAYLNETFGYSLSFAAVFVLVLTMSQLIGTMLGGFIGDRLGRRYLVMVCMWVHAAVLLLFSHGTGLGVVLTFVILHGMAWGLRGPQMIALRADYFGRTSFGRIMGMSSLLIMAGTVTGPLIAGVAYDTTGSYRIGFDILVVIAAASSVLLLLVGNPRPPGRRGERALEPARPASLPSTTLKA